MHIAAEGHNADFSGRVRRSGRAAWLCRVLHWSMHFLWEALGIGTNDSNSTEPITADWWLPDVPLPVCSGRTLSTAHRCYKTVRWITSGSEGGICTFTVTPTFCPPCAPQTRHDSPWMLLRTSTLKREENSDFFLISFYMLTPGQTYIHTHTRAEQICPWKLSYLKLALDSIWVIMGCWIKHHRPQPLAPTETLCRALRWHHTLPWKVTFSNTTSLALSHVWRERMNKA